MMGIQGYVRTMNQYMPPPPFIDNNDALESFLATIRKTAEKSKTFTTVEVWAINAMKVKISKMIPFKTPGIIVAGGCFTSFLQEVKPKDIDIFVLDHEPAKIMARSILDPTGPNVTLGVIGDPFLDINEKEKKAYIEAINHRRKNNANIEDVVDVTLNGQRCQFIFTKYKTREELMDHFDFVHTKVSYDTVEDKLYISKETFDAIIHKNLKIANEERGVEQWRLEKFKRKGWNMWSIQDDLKNGIV
jgi:hypothetical protein